MFICVVSVSARRGRRSEMDMEEIAEGIRGIKRTLAARCYHGRLGVHEITDANLEIVKSKLNNLADRAVKEE